MGFGRISWSRGFFRLWLVIALLWGAFGLFFTGNAFLNPHVYQPTYAYIFGMTSFPPHEVDTVSDEAVAARIASNKGTMIRRTAGVGTRLDIAMYFPADTNAADADYAVGFLIDRLRRERIQALDTARWSKLGVGVFWTAVPPLFLLGAGALLGWIRAGFRRLDAGNLP